MRQTRLCRCTGEKLSITAKIIDLTVGKEQIAVGTLYKDMKLKPNVLDDFSHEVRAALAPTRGRLG